MKILWVLSILVLGSSCGLMDHRQFEDQMTYDRFNGPLLYPGHDFETIAGDNERFYYQDPEVIEKRIPFSADEQGENEYQKSLKREIHSLVNSLSDQEYMQYQKVSSSFKNDSERIYYLNMPPHARRHYLRLRGVDVPMETSVREVAGGYDYPTSATSYPQVQNRSVMLGMRKEQVGQALGRPTRTEVAGNPRYQNERWVYENAGQEKSIYFESGAVGGWTQND